MAIAGSCRECGTEIPGRGAVCWNPPTGRRPLSGLPLIETVRCQLQLLSGIGAGKRRLPWIRRRIPLPCCCPVRRQELKNRTRQRILEQILYHLGRWVYLIDAADDLKKDAESGNYNPVALRYGLERRQSGRRRAAGNLPGHWTTPFTRWQQPLSCGTSACGRRSCRQPFTPDCFRWDEPCWTARSGVISIERTSKKLRKPHERSV